jgi:hypothetical protein
MDGSIVGGVVAFMFRRPVVCVAVWVSAVMVRVVLEGSLLSSTASYLCFLIDSSSHYQEKEGTGRKRPRLHSHSKIKRGGKRSEVAEINCIGAWSCESPHLAEERQ